MVWNRVWFLREVREFMNICIVSTSNEIERKKCEFELDFRNLVFVVIVAVVVVCLLLLFFLLLINLSNNYFLEARSENGCKK